MAKGRQSVVLRQHDEGLHSIPFECLAAARREIPRQDLAHWDASARTWLQVADEVELRRQKQLMLILNNIDLPVSTIRSTYNSVIEAWKTTLSGLENLISGQSQRSGNATVLLGLSSWHIYPDLVALGDRITEVRFEDHIVTVGGVLSLEVQNIETEEKRGLHCPYLYHIFVIMVTQFLFQTFLEKETV
jgi:hypothetical protein